MVVDGRCAHLMSDRMFFVDGLLEERVLMENQKAKKDTRSRCEWNEPGGAFCCALMDLSEKSSLTAPATSTHRSLKTPGINQHRHCSAALHENIERVERKSRNQRPLLI